jgi:F-type H+-transporting ATPase subunit a
MRCVLIGIGIQGMKDAAMFTPKGSPKALSPVLVVIEMVSYIARAVSLGVRLGANMMRGHLLLSVLSRFV